MAGKQPLLTCEEREAFLRSHPDWALNGEVISRTFTWRDFAEAMGFVTRVGLVAQAADHHPDIDVRWNRVTLAITTHSAGGLTGLDSDLASKIDAFFG